MSKGIEKPSFSELLKDLQKFNENKVSINDLDLIRLNWLNIHLDKMLFDKLIQIDGMLSANHNSKFPKMKDFEHWKNNLLQYGFSYNDLEYLKELIQTRVNYLSERQLKPQPLIDKNFQSIENYNRFKYCRDHAKRLNRRYVSILYGYFKNKGLFKFANQLEFAEYWNKVDKGHKIKINVKSAGLDPMSWDSAEHDEIERLIKECNTKNNYVKVE
jgi:hypothetical protein